MDGDQLHQDGRGHAVVGRDAEAIGGGEAQDAGVLGDEGHEGSHQVADDHADAVQGDGGDPGPVTEPPHQHLANGVQDIIRIIRTIGIVNSSLFKFQIVFKYT